MPLVFDSGNLPPRPAARLFYGTFDAEVLPPRSLVLEPKGGFEAISVGLRGATTEGLYVPSETPSPPPTEAYPFGRTGGPDGDMSVVHASIVGQGFRFFVEMAPNPPEIPAPPPLAPPCGPVA